MKKKTIKISLLIITIMMLMMATSNAFTAKTSVDKEDIEVGDEIVYKISCDRNVIGANFNIEYDSKCFEFIESRTNGLNVAKKNGFIACIYTNMENKGVNNFEIAFKAIKSNEEAIFSIDNVKFRLIGQKESNTITNTSGLDDAYVKIEKTFMMNIVYIIIIGIGVIILGITIFVIVNKIKKSGIIEKFVSGILALILVSTLSLNVEAVENSNDIVINFSKLGEEKIVQIVLSKDDEDKQITKEEIVQKNDTIISIKDENGNEIANNEIIKTGYTLETRHGISKIILLGDANGDGYVCDIDDVMVIIDDYLGNETANDIQKIAANLCNTDDILDIDDVMQMIDMYLGTLENNLLVEPLQTNTEVTMPELKFGDVVAYDSAANVKWRIWKVDRDQIQIIPETNVIQECSSSFAQHAISVELNLNGAFTGSNWNDCSSYSEFEYFKNCFNEEYAKEMAFPLQEDYNNYKNSIYFNELFNSYFEGSYWAQDIYGAAVNTTGGNVSSSGLRPVVTLREDVKIETGSGTETDPFILTK